MIPNCERSNKWFSPFLHKLICLFCLVCVSLSLKHRERTKHLKVHVSHYDCSLSLILFLTFWDRFSRQEGDRGDPNLMAWGFGCCFLQMMWFCFRSYWKGAQSDVKLLGWKSAAPNPKPCSSACVLYGSTMTFSPLGGFQVSVHELML